MVERRALLLQAKKINRIPAAPDNKNQWHLYARWPKFKYAARSGALRGKSRYIKEPDMHDAAKYLLLGSAGVNYPSMEHTPIISALRGYPGLLQHYTAHPTNPLLSHYRLFADELFHFLIGNAGKTFIAPPATRARGWDRVIDDLITETATRKTKCFLRRNSSYGSSSGGKSFSSYGSSSGDKPITTSNKFPRGQGVLCFLGPSGQSNHFLLAGGHVLADSNEPPHVPEEWPQGEDEGGGISIIEAVVGVSQQ